MKTGGESTFAGLKNLTTRALVLYDLTRAVGLSRENEDLKVHGRTLKLDPPISSQRDHVIGNPDAEMTLVEFGSYTSASCHAAHEVIADLRDRFGDRLRYAYRHCPTDQGGDVDRRAAELAEIAAATTGEF